tara:strand:+ start:898 stop:1911 length:1014 start_codon:yes stop_codon:yes gene_type:complete
MVEIYKAHILKPTNFYRTVFREYVLIKYCIFFENTVFLNTYVYKKLLISRTNFKSSINLAHLILIDNGNIESYEVKLPSFGLPSSDISHNLDRNESAWKKTPHYKDVQETYRILKNISIKQGNNIEALDLYKQECQNLNRSLWWFKSMGNKLTLFFEQNISFYGTSVVRAFLWFLAINYIVFTDSYILLEYFALIVVTTEVALMLLRMIKITLRISYSTSFTRFMIMVLDYKYIVIMISIIGYIIYLKYIEIMGPPMSSWDSLVQMFKDLSEHISSILLDNQKWRDQMNGFMSSIVPFAGAMDGLKGTLSQLVLHLGIDSVFVYQIIKSLRKYSRKL